jgi:hypothetical protein
MKKLLFLAVLGAFGLAVVAAKCTLTGVTITEIDGEMWYSAEMEYEGPPNILNHKFAVGFIEGQSAVATKTVDGCLRSLQSGNSNFFSANSGLEEDEVDTAVSRLVGPITFGDTVEADLDFSNINVTRDEEQLRVTGRITNNDSDDLSDVRVCVVVRNDDGDITVVDTGSEVDLDSDEFDDFTIDVTVPDDDDANATVDLWADAENGDDITDPVSDLENDVEDCVANTATPTGTLPATNTPVPTNTGTVTATPTATPDDAC